MAIALLEALLDMVNVLQGRGNVGDQKMKLRSLGTYSCQACYS